MYGTHSDYDQSLCYVLNAKSYSFLHVDGEDINQAEWMQKLICVFTESKAKIPEFVMQQFI